MIDPMPADDEMDAHGRRRKKTRLTDAPVAVPADPDPAAAAVDETIVFGLPTGGPVHLAQSSIGRSLSVCGVKSQFRHLVRAGTVDDVTCTKCLGLIAKGETRSWKS